MGSSGSAVILLSLAFGFVTKLNCVVIAWYESCGWGIRDRSKVRRSRICINVRTHSYGLFWRLEWRIHGRDRALGRLRKRCT